MPTIVGGHYSIHCAILRICPHPRSKIRFGDQYAQKAIGSRERYDGVDSDLLWISHV